MTLYTFRQNNSFGVFDYNREAGISINVVVEAASEREAEERAERITGDYAGRGGDCPCCGYRWSLYAAVYDGTASEYDKWYKSNQIAHPTFIHWLDGRIEAVEWAE